MPRTQEQNKLLRDWRHAQIVYVGLREQSQWTSLSDEDVDRLETAEEVLRFLTGVLWSENSEYAIT